MDDARIWMPASPLGVEAAAVIAALLLSLVGPPWFRSVGRRSGDPGLVDRWKLFSFLHPALASVLRWATAIAFGATVSISTFSLVADRGITAHAQQVVADAIHRVWGWN